jgi:hypothetical protein
MFPLVALVVAFLLANAVRNVRIFAVGSTGWTNLVNTATDVTHYFPARRHGLRIEIFDFQRSFTHRFDRNSQTSRKRELEGYGALTS